MRSGGGRTGLRALGGNALRALWLSVLLFAATPSWGQTGPGLVPPGPGGAVDRDVPYGADPAQLLDLYHPASSAPARLVVFVHGGGWMGGRKAGAWQIAPPLLAAGYAMASINYRLFPQTNAAGEVQDAANAIAYLLHNAKRFGLDPDVFYLIGHSSGAHMVALLGTDAGYLRRAGVSPAGLRAVVTLDGVFDVKANLTHYPSEKREQVFGNDPAAWARVSPIELIAGMTAHPRFCLVHEDRVQRFIEQEGLFEAALKKHGEAVQAVVAPGLSHAQLVHKFADPTEPMAAFTVGCFAAAK